MQDVYRHQQDSIFQAIIAYFPDTMPRIPVWFRNLYQCSSLIKHATTTYVEHEKFLRYTIDISTLHMLALTVADLSPNEALHMGYWPS